MARDYRDTADLAVLEAGFWDVPPPPGGNPNFAEAIDHATQAGLIEADTARKCGWKLTDAGGRRLSRLWDTYGPSLRMVG